ncbi:hypothetical protein D1BOALGB6SA_5902 [Olavius sp. associated proteobacterium Delta 1]|nr:hypothetical protein D1BOALGB6SA_5902 [Olavius sp. associated proteobacterium Delta 1]
MFNVNQRASGLYDKIMKINGNCPLVIAWSNAKINLTTKAASVNLMEIGAV